MIDQHLALRSASDALQRLALTGSLPMQPNRRHLEDELLRAMSAASHHGREVCVLSVDVDEFKAVNDTWGHDGGDDVLVAVATSLCTECRLEDVAGRWGGDELVVICPGTDLAAALAVAERIRADVEERTGGPATVGIGVARAEAASLLAADEALHGATAPRRRGGTASRRRRSTGAGGFRRTTRIVSWAALDCTGRCVAAVARPPSRSRSRTTWARGSSRRHRASGRRSSPSPRCSTTRTAWSTAR